MKNAAAVDTAKKKEKEKEQSSITGILPDGFKVPYPDPYVSVPTQSARFVVLKTITDKGIIKTFEGKEDPHTLEKCYDPRMRNNPKYWDTPMRKVDNWTFTAVRTIDAAGNDRSTVFISGRAHNTWNIIRPRDGVLMTRNGFEMDFQIGNQVLLTVVTGKNFSGNLNRCGQSPDTLTIHPFDIPNPIFEAFDTVTIRGKAEAYYGCP